MRAHCKHKCGRFALMAVIGIGLGGLVVMLLWNWVAPTLFGWKGINYLQALALLALSRILIGNLHSRCGHGHWRFHLAERLEQMTPEERERFQAGMKSKWCGCGTSDTPAQKAGPEDLDCDAGVTTRGG